MKSKKTQPPYPKSQKEIIPGKMPPTETTMTEAPTAETPTTEAAYKAAPQQKHSKVTPPNGWGDPRSYLTSSIDENGLTHIRGNYFYNNCDFKFSLVE